jgi:hypothetical protein
MELCLGSGNGSGSENAPPGWIDCWKSSLAGREMDGRQKLGGEA